MLTQTITYLFLIDDHVNLAETDLKGMKRSNSILKRGEGQAEDPVSRKSRLE